MANRDTQLLIRGTVCAPRTALHGCLQSHHGKCGILALGSGGAQLYPKRVPRLERGTFLGPWSGQKRCRSTSHVHLVAAGPLPERCPPGKRPLPGARTPAPDPRIYLAIADVTNPRAAGWPSRFRRSSRCRGRGTTTPRAPRAPWRGSPARKSAAHWRGRGLPPQRAEMSCARRGLRASASARWAGRRSGLAEGCRLCPVPGRRDAGCAREGRHLQVRRREVRRGPRALPGAVLPGHARAPPCRLPRVLPDAVLPGRTRAPRAVLP